MKSLETYIHQFAHLKRATGTRGLWSEATRNRAPHKPILLLAVLDMMARGVVTSNFIDISTDFVELNELFNLYWRRVIPIGQTSSIAFPFSRLHNEPFWELVPQPGTEITSAIVNNISSASQLRNTVLGARIDEDLFHLIQEPASCSTLRETLLQSCFSEKGRQALEEQAMVNAEAYNYSLALEKKAHLPMVQKILDLEAFRPAARDQGFRHAVTKAYDHRCALCGVRIITPDGHTVVDAAHIIPWSQSRNDDIRNGMALCKLCHWAFDEGMMGVSDEYNVITSRHIATNPNVPGFLLTLSGRGIIPPADPDLEPAREFLGEHRRAWRL